MPDNFTIYEGMDRPVLLTLTRVKEDPERGTSGAHDIAIRPEPMRTTEITVPGQPTCGPYQPRSPTTQHKSRPTGLLVRPDGYDAGDLYGPVPPGDGRVARTGSE